MNNRAELEDMGIEIDAAELLDRQWEFFCDEEVPFNDELKLIKGWEDEFRDLGYEMIGSSDWYEFCSECLEVGFSSAEFIGTDVKKAFANYIDGWNR